MKTGELNTHKYFEILRYNKNLKTERIFINHLGIGKKGGIYHDNRRAKEKY